MKYKYITNDNLLNVQNYMYSEFQGMDFVNEYYETRRGFIGVNSPLRGLENEAPANDTEKRLRSLLENLKKNSLSPELKKILDDFTKGFEVRKRIYSSYEWPRLHPSLNANYDYINNYLLLEECLILGYDNGKCLKYLNCILKINDTLLSIEERMNDFQKRWLSAELSDELILVNNLINFERV